MYLFKKLTSPIQLLPLVAHCASPPESLQKQEQRHNPLNTAGMPILYHITGRTPDLQCIFGNHLKPGLSGPVGQVCRSNTETSGLRSNTETPGLQFKQWDPWSAVQTVRPQVCSSNSETPGLKLKYWEPRSAAQILRAQVYISWAVDLGSRYLNFRPWVSVFELQTRGLTVWTADLGSHCLNCRPGVSLFELQTCMGFDIWTSQLLCIEISPPCFLYKHLSAVLLSRPDFRACLAFVEIRPDNAQIFVILPGLLWFSAHWERHWAVCQMACCWTCLDIVADCWLTVLPVSTVRLKENDLRQRRPGSCNFRYSAEYLLVI